MSGPHPQRRVAVFNDTRAAGHYGCEIVMEELLRGLGAQGMEPAWFHPVRVDWRDAADAIPRRPRIDAIIVNGEGSIHHSATRERAVYLAQLGGFARDVLDVPSFLVNASIDAIDPETAAQIGRFDQVYVRESASRRELARFGVNATVVADLTLNHTPPPAAARSGTCATDSVLPDVAKAIRRLARREGWPYRRMSWPAQTPDQPPPSTEEFLAWLGRHALAVTGRFHTVTLCLATGTPFLAVESNTHKISGLLDDVFGSSRRLVTVESLADGDLGRFAAWTTEERASLDAALHRTRQATATMFQRIRQVVDASAS